MSILKKKTITVNLPVSVDIYIPDGENCWCISGIHGVSPDDWDTALKTVEIHLVLEALIFQLKLGIEPEHFDVEMFDFDQTKNQGCIGCKIKTSLMEEPVSYFFKFSIENGEYQFKGLNR